MPRFDLSCQPIDDDSIPFRRSCPFQGPPLVIFPAAPVLRQLSCRCRDIPAGIDFPRTLLCLWTGARNRRCFGDAKRPHLIPCESSCSGQWRSQRKEERESMRSVVQGPAGLAFRTEFPDEQSYLLRSLLRWSILEPVIKKIAQALPVIVVRCRQNGFLSQYCIKLCQNVSRDGLHAVIPPQKDIPNLHVISDFQIFHKAHVSRSTQM